MQVVNIFKIVLQSSAHNSVLALSLTGCRTFKLFWCHLMCFSFGKAVSDAGNLGFQICKGMQTQQFLKKKKTIISKAVVISVYLQSFPT